MHRRFARLGPDRRDNSAMTAKYLTGIDVSQYQGNINWKTVRDAKIDFVHMRSNVGTKQDTYMKDYCSKAGLPFGLYVYIKPEEDVVMQMRMMLDNHKQTGATLIPQIDIEHHGEKKPKELKRLKSLKKDETVRNLLASKFDRETISVLLGIDKNDIPEILGRCNYSESFIKTANDLQIMDAISECYEEYKILKKN